MLIQNLNSGVQSIQAGPTPGRVSSDAPRIVLDIPKIASRAVSDTSTGQAENNRPLSPSQLKGTVDGMNSSLQQAGQSLEFTIDSDTKTPVVKLMDTETGQVIRQFPSEEMLAIARALDQQLQGALLKQKA